MHQTVPFRSPSQRAISRPSGPAACRACPAAALGRGRDRAASAPAPGWRSGAASRNRRLSNAGCVEQCDATHRRRHTRRHACSLCNTESFELRALACQAGILPHSWLESRCFVATMWPSLKLPTEPTRYTARALSDFNLQGLGGRRCPASSGAFRLRRRGSPAKGPSPAGEAVPRFF